MSCKKTKASSCASGKKMTHDSELSKLSSDPQLTKRPDPEFHATFRDADELGEEPLEQLVEATAGHVRKGTSIPGDWSLRRSPKE